MVTGRFISFSSSFFYQFYIVILSLLLVLTCILIVPPFLIWRYVVIFCAKLIRPDLGSAVSGWDIIFGRDFQNWATNPSHVVLMTSIILKNDDSFEKGQEFAKHLLQDPNYKRLRHYIVSFMGYTFWKEDFDFDVNHHVKFCKNLDQNSPPVDKKWVTQLKKKLMHSPFGKNKSPWEVVIIPNYKYDSSSDLNEKHSLVIFRAHHALGDGISFTNIAHKMSERSLLLQNTKFEAPEVSLISKFLKMMYLPFKMPYDVIKLGIEANDCGKTPWCTKPNNFTGISNYAKSKPISTDEIKSIRRKFGVSFVSVILYGITSILRNAMISKNMKIPDTVHCLIPLPLPNRPEEMCNHMTGCVIELPLGISNPLERIQRINEQYEKLKSSTVPLSTMYTFKLLTCFPFWVIQNMEQFFTLVVSIYNSNPNYQDMLGTQMVEKGFSLNVPLLMTNSGIAIGVLTSNYDKSVVTFETNADSSILESDEMVEEMHEMMCKEFKELQL